jgi:hypothetical protein
MTKEEWLFKQLEGLRYQVELDKQEASDEYEDFHDMHSKRSAKALGYVLRRIDNIIYRYQRKRGNSPSIYLFIKLYITLLLDSYSRRQRRSLMA